MDNHGNNDISSQNECLLYSGYVHSCDLCKNLSEDDVMIPNVWRRKPRLGKVVCSKLNSDRAGPQVLV